MTKPPYKPPHKPPAPHDLFFKDIFSQKKFAVELLSLIFSPEEQKLFNFQTLKNETTTFKSHRADLIFSLELRPPQAPSRLRYPPFPCEKTLALKKQGFDISQASPTSTRNNRPARRSYRFDTSQVSPTSQGGKAHPAPTPQKAFIFLILEHKSQKDEAVLVQLLRYQILLYSHLVEQNHPVVPIIPILFYHGKEAWKTDTLFFQNIFPKQVFSPEFEGFFKSNVLNFQARCLNLQAFSTHQLQELKKLKSGLAFYLLKKIWNFKWPGDGRQMLDWVQNVSEKDQSQLLLFGSEYIKGVCGVSQKELAALELEALQTGILRKGGSMGLLEYMKQKRIREIRQEGLQEGRQQGLQQGMQQGRQQGIQKIVLNMLQNKLDMGVICKVTGLSEKEVQKLKNT